MFNPVSDRARVAATAILFGLFLPSAFTPLLAQDKETEADEDKPARRTLLPGQPRPEWIWLKENGRPAPRIYLRKEINVGGVGAARLYASCDNVMTVYLDGRKVFTDESWETPTYRNITPLVNRHKQGARQVLSIEARNVGNNPAGLILLLDLESGWRDPWSIVSDSSWRVSTEAEEGWQDAGFDDSDWQEPDIVGQLGGGPWTGITAASLLGAATLKKPTATPAKSLRLLDGFRAELLHSVPKEEQGSWVNLCVAPKGRLIASDQYGGLYRITAPPPNTRKMTIVEPIDVEMGEAQGLLWAFDSLYVVVNRGRKYESGLYRVRDTDGDDQLDTVEQLRRLNGGGEHGPHAVLLAPDGESLYIVCGNGTQLPEIDSSRVPQVWDEDRLLPRPYGRGFMKGKRAPGGFICRIDPEGKNWELVATGFRNEFDAAFNREGELFSYDADMEWDMNTPWYRPTRVCHVVSGAEFGWRNGGGKWPVYYADSVPPALNVGTGSPTGVCFGYGAAFPEKYQEALFLCDWTNGKLYATHLSPRGAGYTGDLEEFVTGTPLPLTDVIVNPHDGAMYFTIGGRRTQSGLYRVTWAGGESGGVADGHGHDAELRSLRRRLESLHVGDHQDAVARAWPYLKHEDRAIRYAARIAVEHRPLDEWLGRALDSTDTRTALTALLAVARQYKRANVGTGGEIDSPVPSYPVPRSEHPVKPLIHQRLGRIAWNQLTTSEKLELIRIHSVLFCRLGPPHEEIRGKLTEQFSAVFPTESADLNSELARMLVYLQSPTAASSILPVLLAAPTQEEQIDFARSLSHLKAGWTMPLRKAYFEWFVRAAAYKGGASFALFVANIKETAVSSLTAEEKNMLQPLLDATPPAQASPIVAAERPFVREWKLEELVSLVENDTSSRDFDRGRRLFAAANCFACHRFDNQGGAIGPDLTALAGRFSARDILESIVDPSKTVSDQYAAVTIVTSEGKVITGRIADHAGDSFSVITDMLKPNEQIGIDRTEIEEMSPAKTSMMPAGLLNTLDAAEVLDLIAYLRSRGDRNDPVFRPAPSP